MVSSKNPNSSQPALPSGSMSATWLAPILQLPRSKTPPTSASSSLPASLRTAKLSTLCVRNFLIWPRICRKMTIRMGLLRGMGRPRLLLATGMRKIPSTVLIPKKVRSKPLNLFHRFLCFSSSVYILTLSFTPRHIRLRQLPVSRYSGHQIQALPRESCRHSQVSSRCEPPGIDLNVLYTCMGHRGRSRSNWAHGYNGIEDMKWLGRNIIRCDKIADVRSLVAYMHFGLISFIFTTILTRCIILLCRSMKYTKQLFSALKRTPLLYCRGNITHASLLQMTDLSALQLFDYLSSFYYETD